MCEEIIKAKIHPTNNIRYLIYSLVSLRNKLFTMVCVCKRMHLCLHAHMYAGLYVFVFLWFNAIFQHNLGYTWRPALMVEEEPAQPRERSTDP